MDANLTSSVSSWVTRAQSAVTRLTPLFLQVSQQTGRDHPGVPGDPEGRGLRQGAPRPARWPVHRAGLTSIGSFLRRTDRSHLHRQLLASAVVRAASITTRRAVCARPATNSTSPTSS